MSAMKLSHFRQDKPRQWFESRDINLREMLDFLPGEEVCPVCGWKHGSDRQIAAALPLGSKLKDNQYIIGRVLGQGGFGITYIALDTLLKMKVAIKEFYPQNIAIRQTGSMSMTWYCDDTDR